MKKCTVYAFVILIGGGFIASEQYAAPLRKNSTIQQEKKFKDKCWSKNEASSAYYNKWDDWTASWEISNKIREILSPGSLVPIELVELVYTVLKEL